MRGKCHSSASPGLPAYSIESLEARRLLSGFAAHVDFGPTAASAPAGYVSDNGAVMGDRGNGLNYGWNAPHPAQVVEHHVRRGSNGPDERYDTFAVMHPRGR